MTQHWQGLTNEELVRLTRDTPAELVRLLANRLEECLNDNDERLEEIEQGLRRELEDKEAEYDNLATEMWDLIKQANKDMEWIAEQLDFKETDPIQTTWPRMQAVQKWLANREPYSDDV